MTQHDALVVLNAVPGLGSGKIRLLVEYFSGACHVLQQKADTLSASGIVTPHVASNIAASSKVQFLEEEYKQLHLNGCAVVTSADEHFPQSLNDTPGGPVVLYVKGDAALLKTAGLAIVGSRICSYYGKNMAARFASRFAEVNVTVISGLARGIDTAAHLGCLEKNGKTIAVIGCGLNHMYPKENKELAAQIAQKGLIISEMPMGTPPIPANFPRRNRIISGLSLATVVIEAGLKSGALITADYALEQGKDVFVLPANIDYETAKGSNKLIKDGAKVALDPMDILDELKSQLEFSFAQNLTQSVSRVLLTEEQMLFYKHLSLDPVHIDELTTRANQSLSEAAQVMLNLELKGIVRQLPGKYYVKV
jgi:DNA processing protein